MFRTRSEWLDISLLDPIHHGVFKNASDNIIGPKPAPDLLSCWCPGLISARDIENTLHRVSSFHRVSVAFQYLVDRSPALSWRFAQTVTVHILMGRIVMFRIFQATDDEDFNLI
ncbi:hypothetical protein I7I51_07308 [Histoplasma capsulatum]|uniref:Uncharacterized protein n=1 Tax=Ajellomyces capsulatus TaxID=5037 RepID=A0A8A1MK19_AJECA|nr:hypothetical protein I7I51_07308 [Histoplasma capsulatum]